ncbi:phage tail sheath subtilisin-like domain-containing protein [Kingella kingae]|uniref:phage tail sheath subtilisin-like domain-containing protein n=1 Tax=Kingella kingae TaxID=504 RepID=UPI00255165AB|nr:phage tail sheath subtilisin-like domain-containing protein [Kingella kingae]MDK4603850.1 phage tail sheath subtilisin-like domain-containing protein [Kingella kingae]MDK4615246.1 phage tail sheath subtilisin-like domain-containing protein [Kingella kingae]MDK4618083.1 phage tail sheath subtilisin-like domain-containing protein [Kingella kingae]MDK4630188.1 phage tail sheath subtilisin-like domain-containing protein [Kingella kingae]MDK4647833.1 phage tail sheath subtilisin-like domain-cont
MANADRHHGITTKEYNTGARAIDDISTAIIGMVCTADDADNSVFPLNRPVFYTSANEVLGKAGNTGTLAKSLDAIIDQADAQIVIVRVPHSDDANELKANIIGTSTGDTHTGIKALSRAKATLGYTPKILGIPELDSLDVLKELVSVAERTRAFAYGSAGGTAELTKVAEYRKNFGNRELMLIDNEFMAFSTATQTSTTAATIARILGARAKLDKQIGWHKSISNTEINGVSSLQFSRSFDILDSNCDANTLNNADVTTLIREDGFRVWGNRTCSNDKIMAFEVATHSAQIIQETIASGFMWANDKTGNRITKSQHESAKFTRPKPTIVF